MFYICKNYRNSALGLLGQFNKTIYLSINSNKHMKKSDVYMPYDIQK